MPVVPAGDRHVAEAQSVGAYLERLGVDHPGPPSLERLRALHRAHVQRVPYEVLDIQLGRPTTVEPLDCADRVLRGRGGYCVQLNSAFSTLLRSLGYAVTFHRAGVQANQAGDPVPPTDPAPHLALTVRLDDEDWFVDVGLGDGLMEPLPLRAGTYTQGPFTFSLGPSSTDPAAWRFGRAQRASIAGLDIAAAPAGVADFAEWHPFLVTSPESRLVRTVAVMRRDATGADSLTGCMLRRVDGTARTPRELSTMDGWYAALAHVFGLTLDDLDAAARTRLWGRVRAAHEQWLAGRAQQSRTP